jgi:hypothetical protein
LIWKNSEKLFFSSVNDYEQYTGKYDDIGKRYYTAFGTSAKF